MAYDPRMSAKFCYEAVNEAFKYRTGGWNPDIEIPKILAGYLERARADGYADGMRETDKRHREVIQATAETFGKMLARHLLGPDGLDRPKT